MLKGEIWLARLNPTVGDEIGKTRPVVVVSDNEVGILRLKVIVPITSWNDLFSPLTLFKSVLSRNKDLSDNSEFSRIQSWQRFPKHWKLFWIWIE
jgi:PemK-like, MazF-like toxin of type II toxin-antitoxin system